MIRLGLIGAGHLGKIHLKLLQEIPAFELVGFVDQDPEVQARISATFHLPAFASLEELWASVDAVDIVSPTYTHFEYAQEAILQGKHFFVEKPLTQTLDEAKQLMDLLGQAPQLQAQVGHIERFNPAFLAISDRPLNPMFIEGHRLAQYNPRGTDVSVVLDLMIHDLDIILSLVKSPVSQVSASGVAVISDSPDIANARIEFVNGCVANLTASRISVKNMRRLRFFQRSTYLAVDFLKKKTEIFRLDESGENLPPGIPKIPLEAGSETKFLVYEQPDVPDVNALKMELESFAAAILHQQSVPITIADGYRALQVAHAILADISQRQAWV